VPPTPITCGPWTSSSIKTSDRRRIKLFNIVDEHTREALAIRVARTCTGEDVVTALSQIISERGAPAYLRADNGPELIAWTGQPGADEAALVSGRASAGGRQPFASRSAPHRG
jgi:transposase InsO family protein